MLAAAAIAYTSEYRLEDEAGFALALRLLQQGYKPNEAELELLSRGRQRTWRRGSHDAAAP